VACESELMFWVAWQSFAVDMLKSLMPICKLLMQVVLYRNVDMSVFHFRL
jgi:hypothetical protein